MKLSVDIVLFGYVENDLKVLLIRRRFAPYQDQWALPGGFVQENESIEAAVERKLLEETGIADVFTEQLYTFGAAQRDPRERVVSVAYYGLIQPSQVKLNSTYELDTQWLSVNELPPLAFDHSEVVKVALARLQAKLSYQPIGFELLPEKFALSEIRVLYETILNRKFEQANFRKKVLNLGILEKLDEKQQNVAHVAGALFRFNRAEYEKKMAGGFYFEIRFENKSSEVQ